MDIVPTVKGPSVTEVEFNTSAVGVNQLFFLTKQNYNTFKELNIDISVCLDTPMVSDRFKAEIRSINNIILNSLLLERILYQEKSNLTNQELNSINTEAHNYLLGESSGEKHYNCEHDHDEGSLSDCPLEKYYEITPLNTNSGTILLVVVDEGFLRKVTGSQESLSTFFSSILDYMYSIKSLPVLIQPIVQSYLRIKNNEDLLTRIKVSLRSPQ